MTCECGQEATANGKECPSCFRTRLGTVAVTTIVVSPQTIVRPADIRRRSMDRDREKRWNRMLERYRSARMEGIQPATTFTRDVDRALAISDQTQTAFRADRR